MIDIPHTPKQANHGTRKSGTMRYQLFTPEPDNGVTGNPGDGVMRAAVTDALTKQYEIMYGRAVDLPATAAVGTVPTGTQELPGTIHTYLLSTGKDDLFYLGIKQAHSVTEKLPDTRITKCLESVVRQQIMLHRIYINAM